MFAHSLESSVMRPSFIALIALALGCGSKIPANPCGELVRTPAGGCDCPAGSTRDEDDPWLCHYPDGGQARDPNALDPADGGPDGGYDGGYDASEALDAGPADGGCPDRVWYRDRDRDGFGDDSTTVMGGCAAPEGYVAEAGDCDDECSACHPFAPEICDERDNNCNDEVDEGLPQVMCYRDQDGDGFGDAATTMLACACRSGWTQRSDVFDCADWNADVFPGQTRYFTRQYCLAPPGSGMACALGLHGTLIGGSWDYDCNGRNDGQFSQDSCARLDDGSCGLFFAVQPSCGRTVRPLEACTPGSCADVRAAETTQACR